MKIAVYVRNSTLSQAERGTTTDQLAYLEQCAGLHGHEIVAVYTEEAISGKTPMVQRPEGLRMLHDAKAKKFDVLPVDRLDRFGRSTLNTLEALKTLKDLGGGFISATESFGNDPDGQLFLTISAAFAERERQLIITRTTSGRNRVVREGRHPGGPVPFGFMVVEGRLAPSSRRVEALGLTEAEAVHDLFRRIAEGSTLVAECTRSNKAGMKSAKGGLWIEGRMSRRLKETVYIGEYTYNAKTGPIVSQVPPLVDRDLWRQAHAQLRSNMTRHESQRLNLLRGKVKCMTCGGSFVMASRSQGLLYYRCFRQLSHQTARCSAISLRAEPLEAMTWEMCREMPDNPTMITQLGIDHYEHLSELDTNRAGEIQRLQMALAEQGLAKQRVIGLVARGKIAEGEADDQLDLINAEEGRLHAELNTFATKISRAGAYLKRIRGAQATIHEVGGLTDTPTNRRRAIEVILQRIEVRTTGEGRNKKAQLTFHWLGQAPFTPFDINDLRGVCTDAAILNEGDDSYAS
jgi:DNA invertase Pin-like site-specific DNA recombinase